MTESFLPQPLPFTPVTGRARHDGWTPERQRRFIAALCSAGSVSGAVRLVGMSAKSAYALRRRAGENSEFARAWDAALTRNYSDILEQALPLAIEGELVPIFYGGRQVGEYRRHDIRLTLALLRAHAARGIRSGGAEDAS